VFVETFKFTKAKLESLPAAERGQVEYGDTVVNGLRVRVGISGVKSFCISVNVMASSSVPRWALP
jgi:hypothetical protein